MSKLNSILASAKVSSKQNSSKSYKLFAPSFSLKLNPNHSNSSLICPLKKYQS